MTLRYYKLLHKSLIHHGFEYKLGLNIDIVPFNPSDNCLGGGLYFFNEYQLLRWNKYIKDIYYISEVDLPVDAKIYHEEGKSKADKIILKNLEIFDEGNLEKYVNLNLNKNKCLEVVRQNVHVLEYVKNQPLEICLKVVRQNAYALKYVKNQTDKICLEAVKQNGLVLEYVKNQTVAICLEAVRQNGNALRYVKNQTEDICLEAVKEYGSALKYVKTQTGEICLEAVKQHRYALKCVNEEYLVICINELTKYI